MRLSAALIGGLAILSAALPSNDVTERSSLTLVERAADVAVPVISSALEPVSLEFEKRKGGGHGGSGGHHGGGGSSPKPSHKPDPTTKKTDPKPTTTKQAEPAHTTSKDEHTKTTSTKTKSTDSSTSHTTSHTSDSKTSSSHSSTSHSTTGSTTSHSSTLSTSTLIPSATSNAGLCGPATCEAKDSCPLAYELGTNPSSKKTTAKRFADALTNSARDVYYRAARLVGRAGTINLNSADISAARTAGKANPSESTGTNRYLRLGGPTEGAGKTVRTPNDQIFDTWGDSSFYRTIDGLRGCMAVMITSPKGMFSVHMWETIYQPKAGGLGQVLDILKKGAKDEPLVINKKTIAGDWKIKDQFGLSSYGSGKVATGAWSDKDEIHISIMAPSKGSAGGASSSASGAVHPKSDWAAVLKYPTAADQLVSAIQSVVGNVPDERISLYAYNQLLDSDAGLSSGSNGVMTAFVKDGVYAVYAETTKLFEVPIKASGSGSSSGGGNNSDCDDSDTCTGKKCCVVQK